MHAWKYFGNKEEGCQMGKESKLGTNEEVWSDTSGWTTSEKVGCNFCYAIDPQSCKNDKSI